ncbi:PhoX family phosphatase [Sulfitobacter sp. M57]|uniref:PhoX family protein n=3 Tax=Sulfitobacter TaxID=60136 RepID=UPI0023E2EFC2|nr:MULTISPECIES: PhoX family phosphatase [unclassified Sulfitobacter]MDF3416476.1 PhoX family phosphatase [Sulfitobacter sp. KE5]MDF3423969.1 PhoX family phosphatase [Sulfitobacter sp. KE43]MDF3435070.1 PhoX family phosphatase [Sulfitobacter sp. KE42]MDF3460726.1 PhoX family phosphatase [Sulfitobacter sp. S74]MDF3464565.1 PhoX family phosphatase [Sulfitobacter sp. Ks18]
MDHPSLQDISWDEFDEHRDPRPADNGFDQVVERAVSRRGFLSGILAFGSGAAVFGSGVLGSSTSARAQSAGFPFEPIGISTDSDIHVPAGYQWKTLVRWGDPLFSDAANSYSADTGVSLEKSDRVFGENTDGMELFEIEGKEVLVVNSEYANPKINLPAASEGTPRTADEVSLLKNIQGVTVMEIAQDADGYKPVIDSPLNRRITHETQMTIDGPAAGSDLLKTNADPAGLSPKGTMNNCGSGRTLWGTYLTCEENFNGYFGATGSYEVTDGLARYGIGGKSRYAYEKFDDRFDLSTEPNEPNRHGWVTEIDPTNPNSTPVKHTALGRFKHENAEMVTAKDGRVVVYMGDDERGEFIYKYISNDVWVEGGPTQNLLSEGTLYVARFNDDQSGDWLALTPETTGMSVNDILVFSRLAGSKVGATTMDRPEWIAANPLRCEAYCALTNNKNRGVKPNAGGDATPVGGPNPRETNKFGQIVRWRPMSEDHGSDRFTWDLYVMAGNPTAYNNIYAGSENITEGNMFNSPDGMAFDTTGMLWIQTDGNDSNEGDFEGQGNNQMLVGNPETGEIARFLTAPKGAEVTGLCWSLDRKVAFVGIQHPGASWPDGNGKPRSSVIAVWRDNGDTIG